MKTLRIRKYMVMGMLSIVVFPWFVYMVVHVLNTGTFQPWNGPQNVQKQTLINQAVNTISTHADEWTNPVFQSNLRKQLANAGMEVVLRSPSNQQIFQTGSDHGHPWMQSQEVTVVENGRLVGTIQVVSQGMSDGVAALLALCAMILAIFFVGYQMRRHVVKPLEAMSGAALQIAEGDLDVSLAGSRVTEIAQVKRGFEIMVTGLREAFDKQDRLEAERRFFIGAIAHDLRTPLFALRGYLDGLEQGIAKSPEQISKYVQVCKDKSDQLDRLVSDLFSFTKLEYMEQTLRTESVNFPALVENSVESFRSQADAKGIRLTVDHAGEPFQVFADPHLLERAINNLLDNAIRHTPSGGAITVGWRKEYEKIRITVRDTGPGFSSADLAHVFDPLYRGEQSRNRHTGGAGLGLTIAKRIFAAHGGDLQAANQPQGGAVLTGWINMS